MDQLATVIWCFASVFLKLRNDFLYGAAFDMRRYGWITIALALVIVAFISAVWRCRHWELPKKKRIRKRISDREEPELG